jgi:hypothetical protein
LFCCLIIFDFSFLFSAYLVSRPDFYVRLCSVDPSSLRQHSAPWPARAHQVFNRSFTLIHPARIRLILKTFPPRVCFSLFFFSRHLFVCAAGFPVNLERTGLVSYRD